MESIAKEYSNTLEILNKCDYLDPRSINTKIFYYLVLKRP